MIEPKKNPKLDDRKWSATFFNAGLVLSLLLVISAFEWKFVHHGSEVDIVQATEVETLLDPIVTVHPEPPKPKLQEAQIIEKDDDELIEEQELIVFHDDWDINDVIEDISYIPAPVEKAQETFEIVESMPSFAGEGQAGFLKYVAKHLKYPRDAVRHNVDGKVFVQFVIDEKGNMTEIQVMRGLGYGCDEEVMRVLEKVPKWEPGKQRGVPVRVRMVLPISFKLN